MSGWGARRTLRLFGGLLRVTGSAAGLNVSAGGKRGRVGINTKGTKRASANFGHGFRWTRSKR